MSIKRLPVVSYRIADVEVTKVSLPEHLILSCADLLLLQPALPGIAGRTRGGQPTLACSPEEGR